MMSDVLFVPHFFRIISLLQRFFAGLFFRLIMRTSLVLRGAATSNLFAPPNTGRWFNPPYKWAANDLAFCLFFTIGPPIWVGLWLYWAYYKPAFSHFVDKNYYPLLPYTKEFIHKYDRLERWRHY